MPELRWILLGAGVLLVAGLWWWETRRGDRRRDAPSGTDRADGQGSADQRESPEKTDSRIPESDEALVEDDSSGLPPIRASRRQGSAAMRNLPIVDIPAGVDPELANSPRRQVTPHVSYRDMQDKLDDMPADLKNLPHDEASEAEQRLPWVRTQPLDRDEIMGKKAGAETDLSKSAAPEERPPDEEEQPARRQRIVALRVIAHSGRWAGRQLVEALEAEGLTYGKYSIFHRERDDGKTIFYVASMVEPGSFDLASIDALDFPGVSVFSVIPGPVDAPTTFDMMLSTARRLSERLKGHLQDEQGSTLTAQRILNLREELVHLEHVAQRVRKR